MKSYLSLIPISAKVHRRQHRMTIMCIVFAVFLVTSVFSMAEMAVQMEYRRLADKNGVTLSQLLTSGMGQSLFLIAGILFVLILVAGVFMISSSINSNVVGRLKFFGMMRCIGMSKQQIIRFVRLEALNWCKLAIPIGVLLGVIATWILCAILRFLIGEEFATIPQLGISLVGIMSGGVMGIVTVLLAARIPAKRAAKVSPIMAVSGNAKETQLERRAVRPFFLKIETALGIHHALSAKKNLILMTGSFALSIILFLSFSAMIDFISYLLPQSAATPDLTITSGDGANSINHELLDAVRQMEGVKQVYGRQSQFDVEITFDKDSMNEVKADLISFDAFDLEGLAKDGMIKKGSHLAKVHGDSRYVLATWDNESQLQIGDQLKIGDEVLAIAGLLTCDPFSGDGLTHGRVTLIMSDSTFTRLTKVEDFSLVMVQLKRGATDQSVDEIRQLVKAPYIFNDQRDQRTTGTYLAFVCCVYGFLGIIALIAVLNIINSVSMSVSSRFKQYGAMRAVGMDHRQMSKMITAEALTYAVFGCLVGCVIGMAIHRMVYAILIESHFLYVSWHLPITPLMIILLFVFISVMIAVYLPIQRIKQSSVIDTLHEL